MAGLDIICIGAINYDYMFHCTGLDLVETSAGGGDENLSNPISDVENDIQELAIKGKEYHNPDRRFCFHHPESGKAYSP